PRSRVSLQDDLININIFQREFGEAATTQAEDLECRLNDCAKDLLYRRFVAEVRDSHLVLPQQDPSMSYCPPLRRQGWISRAWDATRYVMSCITAWIACE